MKLKLFFKIILLLLCMVNLLGQENIELEYTHTLKEVSFLNAQLQNNYIEILQDPGTTKGGEPYLAPHFIQGNDMCFNMSEKVFSKPVAYVSGTRPKVKAVFDSDCNKPRYIRGRTEEGIEFPAPDKPISPEENENGCYSFIYEQESKKHFKYNKVRYIKGFEITWEFSSDEKNWIEIGRSTNEMYVTHKNPSLVQLPGHIEETRTYETLLHIGCINANGLGIESKIVDSIYKNGFMISEGEDFNKLFRKDDTKKLNPFTYWGIVPNANDPVNDDVCFSVSSVLEQYNATCQGLASLFEDVIRIQGVNTTQMVDVSFQNAILSQDLAIEFEMEVMEYFGDEYPDKVKKLTEGPNSIPQSFLIIRKWDIEESEKFVTDEWKNKSNHIFEISFEIPNPITLLNGNTIQQRETDGIPAHGNYDPRSEFRSHAIIKYNDKYYDPSYGSPIAYSEIEWENNSLVAVSGKVLYTYNNEESNMMQDIYINWIISLNDVGNSITLFNILD